MELKIFENHGVKLFYWVQGQNPELLIHTGTHGDEASVIELVGAYLTKNEKELPNFLWVPEVSPSAVKLRQRKNKNSVDLNRVWNASAIEPEALANLELIKDLKFKWYFSFHEDRDLMNAFYICDAKDHEGSLGLSDLRSAILKTGAVLFYGYADIESNLIKNGYCFDEGIEGYSHVYLKKSGQARVSLIPEIPTQATPELKYKLIETVFEQCLKWQ